MKRKKYCIYGFVERYVTARLGKGSISFHFKDGVLDAAGVQPAVFVTANPLEQALLESHPDFKKGVIKLLDVKVVEEPKEEKRKVTAENVTSLAAARQYLMEQGVSIEDLQNKAACLNEAAKRDIVFPNWK